MEEIAHRAIERRCGARGLKAIMEEFLMKIMYELPDKNGVNECKRLEVTVIMNTGNRNNVSRKKVGQKLVTRQNENPEPIKK